MFLTRLSMRFHSLAQAALDGNYHVENSSFFNDFNEFENPTRLRAEVHRLNGQFAADMRENAQKRKLVDRPELHTTDQPDNTPQSDSISELDDGQMLVNKGDFNVWVKEVYARTRGRELPGNYNHVLLSELFHEQSSRWGRFASDHVTSLFDKTKVFVERVLLHVIAEDKVRGEILRLTANALETRKENAQVELQRIVDDEKRQPITYNHYFTDNIQNARQDSLKKAIQSAMKVVVNEDWNGKFHISNNQLDSDKLLASLQKRVIVNMDDQACSEALAGLTAYYKVAMKTFVDNICRQVIERHLLCNLPDVFSPTAIMSLSDGELIQIASEPETQQRVRETLVALEQGLRDSLRHLQR